MSVVGGRRVGVMGGTFDPVHHGHLVAASEVAHRFALDEVVFVPTGRPWQKVEREITPPEHRYLMTVIATAGDPRFRVSRVDIDREGPTYTVDTLRDLHAEYAVAGESVDLYFISGADAIAAILTWHQHEQVLELAHLVAVTRPGFDVSISGLPEDAATVLEVPALAISSSDCRARVAEGAPWRYLAPDTVVAYATKHALYASESVR